MLAIGRSVSRPRLHSSLPVAAFSTAADFAPTPAGPAEAGAAGAAPAVGAVAASAADADRATPASRPVTRTVRRPLAPMAPPLNAHRTTGASLSVAARGRNRLTLIRLRFFFNDTATTEIYTLSLHDALPI